MARFLQGRALWTPHGAAHHKSNLGIGQPGHSSSQGSYTPRPQLCLQPYMLVHEQVEVSMHPQPAHNVFAGEAFMCRRPMTGACRAAEPASLDMGRAVDQVVSKLWYCGK